MNEKEKRADDLNHWGMGTIGASKTIQCKDCLYCYDSYSDDEYCFNAEKANCVIYPYESGETKPNDVYFKGKPCLFFKKGNPRNYLR